MVDGLDDLLVHLGVATAHGEALGAGFLHTNAHDGGDGFARDVAMEGNVNGEVESHVQAESAACAYQLKHLLPLFGFKCAEATARMRKCQQISRAARVEGAVNDLFDKVGQLEVHLLFVLQGQRVAFASQLDGEERVGFAAFNL